MKHIYFILFPAYYILGAYATTDILRLLRGATVPVLDQKCYCPICDHQLKLTDQLPIISYLLSKGKCRYCAAAIPVSNLIPEILLFTGFSLLNILTGFQWTGYILTAVTYESLKFLAILRYGARRDGFFKNLCLSILQNIILFLLLAFLYLICQIA